MEYKTVELNEMKLVGMKCRGTCDSEKNMNIIPPLWKNFMSRLVEIKSKKNEKVHYGISFNSDEKACDFDYLACVEVENLDIIPKGMTGMTLKPSKYSVATYKGPISKIGTVYGEMMQDAESGKLKQDKEKPWLELYDERFTNDDKAETDIYIPIL